MIAAKTFQFLRDLEKHNDKDWFEAHRDAYDEALANVTDFASALIKAAPRYDGNVAKMDLDPRRAVSRIYTDKRFHPDREPYRPEWYLLIGGNVPQGETAGYYVRLRPAQSYSGGGLFSPTPDMLTAMRKRISGRFDEWQDLMADKRLDGMKPDEETGPETLKSMPHGFDKDDPAADWLRLKGQCAHRRLTRN